MTKFSRIQTIIAGLGLITILFSSCDKTDKYYDVLQQQPEVFKNYEPLYSVKDTMIIEGRFNETDLQIRIGDAEAKVLKIERREYLVDHGFQDSIQHVRVLIDSDMGVGVNRPVSITSSGITVQAPAIEIVEDNNAGVLLGKLKAVRLAYFPANSESVYCRSGTGNLYFINKGNYTITRMQPDGTRTEVFNASSLKDNDGTPFVIQRLNGSGIEPNEQYLYLSMLSRGATQDDYRLVRYNLKDQSVTVLNKTPYPHSSANRILEAAQPFEGNIAQVKLFTVTGIYPDRAGNIYFEMDQRFISRMTKDGEYNILFKVTDDSKRVKPIDYAPLINNPDGGTYSGTKLMGLFPGTAVDKIEFDQINPEENEYFNGLLRIAQVDMLNQTEVFTFVGTGIGRGGSRSGLPYVSGSFDILTGISGSANLNNDMWGRMPIGPGKLLILYHQKMNSAGFPAWAVLDFNGRRGYRYAPGAFDASGYTMTQEDVLLNYDEDGMLYMTSNNKLVILKTTYQ